VEIFKNREAKRLVKDRELILDDNNTPATFAYITVTTQENDTVEVTYFTKKDEAIFTTSAITKKPLSALELFDSMDELKLGKKILTRLANNLNSKAYKQAQTMKDLAREANRTFSYEDEERKKSELYKAVWDCVSFHPFYKGILAFPTAIKTMKDSKQFPELVAVAESVYAELEADAVTVGNITEHIEAEQARLKGTTAQQFLLATSRSKELTDANRQAMIKYSATLDKWKATTVKEGIITVNGVEVGSEARVGIMIGRGIRVHSMTIEAGTYKDKETDEIKETIYVKNYTQWQWSDLVVLDLIENIPSEVIAER
jgi:hypothetical protein